MHTYTTHLQHTNTFTYTHIYHTLTPQSYTTITYSLIHTHILTQITYLHPLTHTPACVHLNTLTIQYILNTLTHIHSYNQRRHICTLTLSLIHAHTHTHTLLHHFLSFILNSILHLGFCLHSMIQDKELL